MNSLLRPGKLVVAAALLSGLALLAPGRAPARAEADAKQIARLIEELGDDEPDTRKAAEKKLGDIGEPALEQLRRAAKGHADPDVRLRAILLARAIERGVFGEIRKFTAHAGAIRHIAVSRDGKRALTGSMDFTMKLWDVDTGKELRTMAGHGKNWVWQVAFSPDEKFALSSGSLDRALRLWNLDDGKEVRKYEIDVKTLPPAAKSWRFYGAAFSPDGKYVLAGLAEDDRSLRLFDRNTGAEVRRFEGHTGWVWKVAFSPDGKRIASAGCNDYSYRIWDVESGKALIVGTKAHNGFVVGIAFSPDGRRLLTSGRDQKVKLWEVETGKLVKTYDGPEGNVEAVAFSRDGKRFLAGENKRVHLFDTETGKILHRFEDHTDYVYAVAFVDDRHALSGGADNTMRLWGLPR